MRATEIHFYIDFKFNVHRIAFDKLFDYEKDKTLPSAISELLI